MYLFKSEGRGEVEFKTIIDDGLIFGDEVAVVFDDGLGDLLGFRQCIAAVFNHMVYQAPLLSHVGSDGHGGEGHLAGAHRPDDA